MSFSLIVACVVFLNSMGIVKVGGRIAANKYTPTMQAGCLFWDCWHYLCRWILRASENDRVLVGMKLREGQPVARPSDPVQLLLWHLIGVFMKKVWELAQEEYEDEVNQKALAEAKKLQEEDIANKQQEDIAKKRQEVIAKKRQEKEAAAAAAHGPAPPIVVDLPGYEPREAQKHKGKATAKRQPKAKAKGKPKAAAAHGDPAPIVLDLPGYDQGKEDNDAKKEKKAKKGKKDKKKSKKDKVAKHEKNDKKAKKDKKNKRPHGESAVHDDEPKDKKKKMPHDESAVPQ